MGRSSNRSLSLFVKPIDGKEKELVRLAKQGDKEAFVSLIQPYHERVYATAIRLLGNSSDAADITQEAILRTFWKIQTFHGRAHFATWLYRTALNLCYRRLSDTQAKIQRRAVSLDQSLEGTDGEPRDVLLSDAKLLPRDEASREEEIGLVRQALSSLDPSDFQILILREFEELSYDLIARRLNIPEGTVMSRLHRARAALGQRLKELGIS